MSTQAERRRSRRTDLEAPVELRNLELAEAGTSQQAVKGQVKNLSLNGFYCTVVSASSLQPGQRVLSNVAIPREQSRHFPFARMLGRGWIVRVEPTTPSTQVGVAVAFDSDATALGTLEV